MLKGFAGTAIELEGFDPEAYRVDKYLELRRNTKRGDLSVHRIESDLNPQHIENIAVGQFLSVLISFAPDLGRYAPDVEKFYKDHVSTRRQLPPDRKTKVYPLGTNSADEAQQEGMKAAVHDFLTVQLGITEETLNNRLLVFSGDGLTFEQLIKLVKNMSGEQTDYQSLRFVVPMLELWHTKWTDLSRVIRGHAGIEHPDDPSSLAAIANAISVDMPPNLKKVPFYEGAHILDITLDAYLLCCWEAILDTDDLVEYFKTHQEWTFPLLVNYARLLAKRYASLGAYSRARYPHRFQVSGDDVPLGTPWDENEQPRAKGREHGMEDERSEVVEAQQEVVMKVEAEEDQWAMDDDDDEVLSDLSEPTLDMPCDGRTSNADITLANATLIIRDGIWWREEGLAAGGGDPGRIWEILKVSTSVTCWVNTRRTAHLTQMWTITFAGSGNTNYTQYLLELYCNVTWEFPRKFLDGVMDNWLVNLHGEPGRFIEKDLMQEHFNFWLEELAAHKGKEFSDAFYRDVISMHVHNFLRIKEEMEDLVSLKARKKTHSEPHLHTELRAAMNVIRQGQVVRRRPGRHMGFEAEDHYGKGRAALKDTIPSFIERTKSYMNPQGNIDEDMSEPDAVSRDENGETASGHSQRRAPPPPLYVSGGQLMVPVWSVDNQQEDSDDDDM
ncbi:hypothetical protein PsYK624_166970 [Phanerochaete sordida]|uniref:DUF6589 domain-containing protein n=1 Tax=Phanerochaete sordida TaxID=48140 RepID=A0A9P3LM39_9APHY|nr:hypothetical protein PsYK624_166970 [Phanerochaete sordida]